MTRASKETKDKIASMLLENTGCHFLDSGGNYGRHWQRNQGRNFDNEPESTLTGRWDYLEVTHNVYHWLCERVEYNEELDNLFQAYLDSPKHRNEYGNMDKYDLEVMQEFVDELSKREELYGRSPCTGIYGEGEPIMVNTYNEENMLSQTLQFLYWSDDNGEHILLQIHGGCDVRGGYTRPVAFDCNETAGSSELAIFGYARGTIYCTNNECDHGHGGDPIYWTTDEGHHWYTEVSCGSEASRQLEKYTMARIDSDIIGDVVGHVESQRSILENQQTLPGIESVKPLDIIASDARHRAEVLEEGSERQEFWQAIVDFCDPDLLIVTDSGDVFCPYCRVGKLAASQY